MKKKIIIAIVLTITLIIGLVGTILWKNRTISKITLDINPSIQINLKNNKKVKNVVALNKDAKELITNKYNNKTLEETFELLITKLIDKGYIDEKNIDVIIYTKGKIDNKQVATDIEFIFGKKDVHTEVIIIDKITKKDEELAKKYHVSPAKVEYINTIIKENKNINLETLVSKSVRELNETKTRGKYCDVGYTLEGDFCLKEIERKTASKGEICPKEYYEYKGKCYEETNIMETDNYICSEEFTLNGTKCSRTIIDEAEPSKYACPKGEAKTRSELKLTDSTAGDANNIVCVDYSSATHPVSPCETHDGTEYTMSGGKCYWHRAPVIESGCPGKIQINGMCWDDASNIYICEGYRDGKRYSSRSEYCENSIKYINPTITEYKCQDGFTLNGSKCEKKEEQDADREKSCPSGYTKVEYDRCINMNKTANKENGLICEGENTKLKGNTCIIYEIVEAKSN